MSHSLISIHGAKVVSGRGRGKGLGIPTINVELQSAPPELTHGIYAARVWLGTEEFMGAVHFGPRPAFQDTDALEIHIIDEVIEHVPESIDMTIVGRIRDVEDFASTDLLVRRIQEDILAARAMLQAS